jgi:hypothetical protein
MERADHHLNSTEIPAIANRILRKYKRDRSYFEHYSPKFDNEFLISFEERIDTMTRLKSMQALENEITRTNEKIRVIISHFDPLLTATEAFLHCEPKVKGFPIANFSLVELRDALNRRCILEIQRSCQKIIDEFEVHIEEFIDRGFLSIILHDLHVFLEKLKNSESELTDISHLRDMMANEYLMIDRQVEYYIQTIIESSTRVFGENNTDKKVEYSIEKLMTEAHFLNSDRQ